MLLPFLRSPCFLIAPSCLPQPSAQPLAAPRLIQLLQLGLLPPPRLFSDYPSQRSRLQLVQRPWG